MDITVSKLRPLKGSSEIPLLKNLKGKGALISMNNKNQQCFKWAVTRALNPIECHQERVRKQSENYNWGGIEFPTPCSENVFKKFERTTMCLYLYSDITLCKQRHISFSYTSQPDVTRPLSDLFFLQNGDQTHYCVINDFSKLVGSQASANKHKKIHL